MRSSSIRSAAPCTSAASASSPMQGHGVAAALIDAAVEAAEGYDDVTVVAREELPETIRFWERQGFREIRRESPNVELRRPLRTAVYQAPDAEAMRGLGRSMAGQLAPGDLIVLTGSLGAGKTTFTQGLGAGLGVRGAVTSPTFVIARVHPSEVGGPALVHVDAYRIGGIAELDDLDLDTSLDDAVTVVEWGEGAGRGAGGLPARGADRPRVASPTVSSTAPGRDHPGRPALARALLPGARMTTVVAHISDTHVGGPPDARARAEAVLAHLLALDPRPDVTPRHRRRRRPRAARGVRRGPRGPRRVARAAAGRHRQPRRPRRLRSGLLDREATGPLVQVLETPTSGCSCWTPWSPPATACGSTTASSPRVAGLARRRARPATAGRRSSAAPPAGRHRARADGADPAARTRPARCGRGAAPPRGGHAGRPRAHRVARRRSPAARC